MPAKPATKAANHKAYFVPRSVQLTFVISVALIYLLLIGFVVITLIMSFTGSSYGPPSWTEALIPVVTSLPPILYFGIAYALNPRGLGFVSRSFESLLLSISGICFWMLVSYVSPYIAASTANTADGSFSGTYLRNSLIGLAISLVLYIGLLLWLRRAKLWS